MGVHFNLKGVQETIDQLDLIDRRTNEKANEALKLGGNITAGIIRANTPVLSGEAKSNVEVGNVSTNSNFGHKSIKVGYNSNVAWRMWFLEEGTYSKGNPKGIAPRKMVAKSLEKSKIPVEQVMGATISEAFGGG